MDKRYLFAVFGAIGGALVSGGWVLGCDDPDCHRTQTCAGGDGPVGLACTEGTGMDAGAACSVHCNTSCQVCNPACTDGGAIPSCRECLEGFETFWPASAEVMANCLATAASASPCDVTAIEQCLENVRVKACDPNQAAEKLCAEIDNSCKAGTFDIGQCYHDIVPFHDNARSAYKGCMDGMPDAGFSCLEFHFICLQDVKDENLTPP